MPVLNVREETKYITYSKSIDVETMAKSGNARRVFSVVFSPGESSAEQAAMAAVANAGGQRIPREWETWPGQEWVYVDDIQVAVMESAPNAWLVTVSYTTIDNPLEQDWTISWDSLITNEEIDRDNTGAAIRHSSGETPDPAITEDIHDLILRVGRNEASYDPLLAHQFNGAINNDIFYGFNPGFVKCAYIKADRARVASMFYYQAQYELHFRLRPPIPGTPYIGWIRRVLDQSYTTKSEDGTITVITDSKGKQLPQPSLLDGFGGLLAEGADPVFLEFVTRRQMNFSILNL